MPGGGCCVWDFTASLKTNSKEAIESTLRLSTKKWCFQQEKGVNGYDHFQGRFSLKTKLSSEQVVLKKLGVDWALSRTSTENRDNDFYCCKSESWVAGPWKDTDVEKYIPWQLRGKLETLYPWQQTIYDQKHVKCDRTINCIYDNQGNVGKSTFASLMDCLGEGLDLDVGNNSQEIVQDLCDQCIGMKTHDPKMVFVDLERATDQTKLWGLYVAIERIKKGRLVDRRYKYTKWWIDSPQIWVFCNKLPRANYLSKDRWRFWVIDDNKCLRSLSSGDVAALRAMQSKEEVENI